LLRVRIWLDAALAMTAVAGVSTAGAVVVAAVPCCVASVQVSDAVVAPVHPVPLVTENSWVPEAFACAGAACTGTDVATADRVRTPVSAIAAATTGCLSRPVITGMTY